MVWHFLVGSCLVGAFPLCGGELPGLGVVWMPVCFLGGLLRLYVGCGVDGLKWEGDGEGYGPLLFWGVDVVLVLASGTAVRLLAAL